MSVELVLMGIQIESGKRLNQDGILMNIRGKQIQDTRQSITTQ